MTPKYNKVMNNFSRNESLHRLLKCLNKVFPHSDVFKIVRFNLSGIFSPTTEFFRLFFLSNQENCLNSMPKEKWQNNGFSVKSLLPLYVSTTDVSRLMRFRAKK